MPPVQLFEIAVKVALVDLGKRLINPFRKEPEVPFISIKSVAGRAAFRRQNLQEAV